MRDPFKHLFASNAFSDLGSDFGIVEEDILEFRDTVVYGPETERRHRPRRRPASTRYGTRRSRVLP